MKYLIDTHFHLDHYKNYLEIADKVNLLQQYTIAVTNSPGVFLSCKNIFSDSKYLKFAIGFHPQEAHLKRADLNDFMKLANRTEFVGEVGLDYSKKTFMDPVFQKECFEEIIRFCAMNNKILTIHIRKAEEDAISILEKYKPKKAIIHWYTGNEDHLQQLLDLDCFFSINTNMVSGKNADKYRIIPINRILIESDGPYTKVKGKRYSPEMLLEAYSVIAEFYKDRDLIMYVYNNFRELLLL